MEELKTSNDCFRAKVNELETKLAKMALTEEQHVVEENGMQKERATMSYYGKQTSRTDRAT